MVGKKKEGFIALLLAILLCLLFVIIFWQMLKLLRYFVNCRNCDSLNCNELRKLHFCMIRLSIKFVCPLSAIACFDPSGFFVNKIISKVRHFLQNFFKANKFFIHSSMAPTMISKAAAQCKKVYVFCNWLTSAQYCCLNLQFVQEKSKAGTLRLHPCPAQTGSLVHVIDIDNSRRIHLPGFQVCSVQLCGDQFNNVFPVSWGWSF